MDRISYVYIMRIVFINLLIMVLTLCIFVLDVRDDLGDRLGHAFTMLLTAVAYSLVVGDSLPTLGYLTWLDEYIFGTYSFLALVVIEFTALASPLVPSEKCDDLNNFFLRLDVGLLVLMQVCFYVTARNEINKTKLLRTHAQDLDLKLSKDVSFLARTTKAAEPMIVTDVKSVLQRMSSRRPITISEQAAAVKLQKAWRRYRMGRLLSLLTKASPPTEEETKEEENAESEELGRRESRARSGGHNVTHKPARKARMSSRTPSRTPSRLRTPVQPSKALSPGTALDSANI
jgi:hypothetical protein